MAALQRLDLAHAFADTSPLLAFVTTGRLFLLWRFPLDTGLDVVNDLGEWDCLSARVPDIGHKRHDVMLEAYLAGPVQPLVGDGDAVGGVGQPEVVVGG